MCVTAVIINFNTPDLTCRSVNTLRRYYAELPLLLIDNGSKDESVNVLDNLQRQSPNNTTIIVNTTNLHHGPAMDQALRELNSPYVFFFDSDCEVLKGGFIEAMASLLDKDPNTYAAGHFVYMNRRGFDVAGGPDAIPYIRPYCMMIKRALYFNLPKFQRHGTPCLANMNAAAAHGYAIVDFPVAKYVHHAGRGTAGKFGYQLGIRGKLNYLLNKFGL